MTTATPTVSPAALYLANLSAGRRGMRQSLDAIAQILTQVTMPTPARGTS